jgi:hypothetical protein
VQRVAFPSAIISKIKGRLFLLMSDWTALMKEGFTVDAVGPDQIVLGRPSTGALDILLSVVTLRAPLSPSHVERLGSRFPLQRILIVVPSASGAALDLAAAHGWSVLATSGRGTRIVLGDSVLDVEPPRVGAENHPPRRPGRPAYGAFAVGRQLLRGRPVVQAGLASTTGLTQPRVSQVLADLSRRDLVSRWSEEGAARWSVPDWDKLLDWWMAGYPGPGGVATSWFGLRPVREQAEAAVEVVRGVGGKVAVSGDVAADDLAPWRLPRVALAYVDLTSCHGPDLPGRLVQAGLTPAAKGEATLEIRFPADPGIWGDAADGHIPVANEVQVLWDVQRSGGSDAGQAAARLRAVIRDRAASRS